jgi:Ca2+-dependent lipid-binding protein
LCVQGLYVHCFDYDFGSADDDLGHARVDLNGIESGEVKEYALALSEQGTVHLSVVYLPPQEVTRRAIARQTVSHAPTTNPGTTLDPAVSCAVHA